MPSLGTKVKGLLAKPRLPTGSLFNGLIPLVHLNGGHKPDELRIPSCISDGLPQELYECILHFLQDDKQTLQACSVVCHAWRHVCDKWLFTQPLRPYCLTSQSGYKFNEPLRCAAIHDGTKTMLYGTAKGIYFRDMTKPKQAPCLVLRKGDVQQLDIADRSGCTIVIWRSGQRIYMTPIQHLDPRIRAKSRPDPSRWERSCDGHYSLGTINGSLCIAAVNSKQRFLVEIKRNSFAGNVTVISTFGTTPLGASIAHGQVITALPTMFSSTDVKTKMITMTRRPTNTPPGVYSARPLTTAAGIQNNSPYTLACYKEFAMFLNEQKVACGQPITWSYIAQRVAFQDNYIFVFSTTHLEIRHLFKRDFKQVIAGKFHLLNGTQDANKVVLMRENGYIFGFKLVKQELE
ncbi:hypothetical protein BDN72DRAFT_960508 [Pluteus cervinus]|uniref:Uncharacterized protein n=1 Tax=Pluteus cervinus TaxID=181527 RepID=A0ACD3AR24_9AGAR|nr:hypothetical protein BDN72DRAFT_960508 [Pluteus cervinus]